MCFGYAVCILASSKRAFKVIAQIAKDFMKAAKKQYEIRICEHLN
jgi:hypothetical protein